MEAAGASVSVAPAQGAIAGGAIEVPALTPRTGAPLGLPQQSSSPPTGRPLMTGDPGLQPSLPGARRPEGYANGHGGQGPFSGSPTTTPPDRLAGADNAAIAQRRSTTGINPTLQVGGGAGGGDDRRQLHAEPVQKQAPREPLALPATLPTGPARDDGPQDLAALIEHVRRSDVQHKDALIDLLRVVEDFYRGRGSREDAVAHWRSFADYVVQYLGDVDGLIAQTERFGRHMLAR